MIEVANLTKRYAGRTAVSDVSFTVGRGEIVVDRVSWRRVAPEP